MTEILSIILAFLLIGGSSLFNGPADIGGMTKPKSLPKSYEVSNAKDVDANKIIDLINEYRTGKGLNKLSKNDTLKSSSKLKVADMDANDYFGHYSPSGEKWSVNFKKAGYKYKTSGEVLAIGYATPAEIVIGWENSPSHNNILIYANYKEINCASIKTLVACHFGEPTD